MNIAILIDYYPPNHDGGDSVFARDLAIGLKEVVTPVVFTRIPKITLTKEFDDSGIKVVYLGDNWQEALRNYVSSIDLVHFFQVDNLPVVQFIKERKNVPTLFHMEISYKRYSELFEPDYDQTKYHQLEQKAVELSDKLIVPCNNELRQISRMYSSTNAVMIPNGINYNLRLQTPFKAPRIDNKTNFAFIGRLDDPMKGGDTVIEAIGQLSSDYLNKVSFTFIGCRDTRFLNQFNTLGRSIEYEIYTWISN